MEMIELQRLYRSVILNAIHDVGHGTESQVGSVIRWLGSDSFEVCCELANWDSLWVREIFRGSLALTPNVRVDIVRETLELLRGMMRLGKQDRPGHEGVARVYGVSKTSYDDATPMEHSGRIQIGKLHKMAGNKSERTRGPVAND